MLLYGFFWCDNVYESADRLISLHGTKLGAFKAKIKYLNDIWQQHRDDQLRYGMLYHYDYALYDRPSDTLDTRASIEEIETKD